MSSCLLSQTYGKHPQRWRSGTTEATIKPAATNTLPRRLAKPRCFLEKTGHSATQEGNHNMNNPTQTEPQNNTVAPGTLKPHSISSASIGQLDAEKERLQRTYWLWGQIQKWYLYVFPLVLVLMIYLVITHAQFRVTAPIMVSCAGWGLVAMQQHQRGILNEIKELDTKLPDQSKAQRRD